MIMLPLSPFAMLYSSTQPWYYLPLFPTWYSFPTDLNEELYTHLTCRGGRRRQRCEVRGHYEPQGGLQQTQNVLLRVRTEGEGGGRGGRSKGSGNCRHLVPLRETVNCCSFQLSKFFFFGVNRSLFIFMSFWITSSLDELWIAYSLS